MKKLELLDNACVEYFDVKNHDWYWYETWTQDMNIFARSIVCLHCGFGIFDLLLGIDMLHGKISKNCGKSNRK